MVQADDASGLLLYFSDVNIYMCQRIIYRDSCSEILIAFHEQQCFFPFTLHSMNNKYVDCLTVIICTFVILIKPRYIEELDKPSSTNNILGMPTAQYQQVCNDPEAQTSDGWEGHEKPYITAGIFLHTSHSWCSAGEGALRGSSHKHVRWRWSP